jgi:hypothetical protein
MSLDRIRTHSGPLHSPEDPAPGRLLPRTRLRTFRTRRLGRGCVPILTGWHLARFRRRGRFRRAAGPSRDAFFRGRGLGIRISRCVLRAACGFVMVHTFVPMFGVVFLCLGVLFRRRCPRCRGCGLSSFEFLRCLRRGQRLALHGQLLRLFKLLLQHLAPLSHHFAVILPGPLHLTARLAPGRCRCHRNRHQQDRDHSSDTKSRSTNHESAPLPERVKQPRNRLPGPKHARNSRTPLHQMRCLRHVTPFILSGRLALVERPPVRLRQNNRSRAVYAR